MNGTQSSQQTNTCPEKALLLIKPYFIKSNSYQKIQTVKKDKNIQTISKDANSLKITFKILPTYHDGIGGNRV